MDNVENNQPDKNINFIDQVPMKEYMHIQLDEIDRYKWIMSERAGKDLGQHCILEWIKKYAHIFRRAGKCPKY